MQPTFKQVPPNVGYFSMMVVLNPNCAARMAATYPPGPEPITATSVVIFFMNKHKENRAFSGDDCCPSTFHHRKMHKL
jgi:hypothetical protein